MRRMLLLCFLLFVSLPALARQRAQGYCTQGGVTPTVAGLNVSPTVQATYPGCTVTVFLAGTQTTASIFADNSGTVKANPFTADTTTGLWVWYADNGRYDVRLSGGGIPTPFTVGDIELTDIGVTPTFFGATYVGSVTINQVGTPAAPVVTVNGTPGSTTYSYFCVGKDGLSNQTLPSAGTTITNGTATPNNTVSCGGQTGALSYIILKTNTSTQLGTCTTTSGAACTVNDTGQATSAYTAQTSDQTGKFSTTGLGTHSGTETFGSGTQASSVFAAGLRPVTPRFISAIGGQSSFNINSPDFYSSRLDTTTGTANCTAQLLYSPCDELVNRIDFSNVQTGGVVPNMVGLAVQGIGFATNTAATGFVGNFQVAIGSFLADASTSNIVHMRTMNPIVAVNSLPNKLDGSGQVRSAFTVEADTSNGSGTDARFNDGTIGNYIGGYSAVSGGANNSTLGFAVGSNSSSGKGFLTGFYGSGLVNAGLALYHGNSVSPVTAIHVATNSTTGIAVGSGTITEAHNSADTLGNPTTGILLDALGTAGTVETQNSNTLIVRAKTGSSVGSDWKLFQSGSDNQFHFNFGGVDKFFFDSNGNAVFVGNISGRGGTAFYGTFAFANTANRTYTLPDVTANVVLDTATQTLTGKTLGGAGSTTPNTNYNRLRANQGTALVSGDFAASAGWGTTATVSAPSGTDSAFVGGVASSGTGQAANPTLTFTFHDGAFTGGGGPIVVCGRGDISAPSTAPWAVTSTTTTQAVITFVGTPVAGNTYFLFCTVTGRP